MKLKPMARATVTMAARLNSTDKKNWELGTRDMTVDGADEIEYAEGFAGTRITEVLLNLQAGELNDEMGTDFKYVCTCAAESDEATRLFITSNSNRPVTLLVEFTRELAAAEARDTRSGKFMAVPNFDVFTFGFTCDSNSRNNSKVGQNRGCIQEGREKSGEGFAEVQVVVMKRRPRKLYGENLRTLDYATPNHEFPSESAYIREWFHDMGYWCESFIVYGEHHGSFASRVRWMLYAMRSDVK